MSEEIVIEGWKGKGETIIEKDVYGYYKVIEYRKNKETNEVYEDVHEIPGENVSTLWKLIRDKCDLETKYGYKYLVRLVLNHYKFHEKENVPVEYFMEAFNGGKNRSLFYFPYLYYPLKVLEAKGYVQYFGRGGIQRLV